MRRGDWDWGIYRGETMKRHTENIANYSQEERPQKKPILSYLDLAWTSSLLNYEKIKFYCLSHTVCGICCDSTSRLTYVTLVCHKN